MRFLDRDLEQEFEPQHLTIIALRPCFFWTNTIVWDFLGENWSPFTINKIENDVTNWDWSNGVLKLLQVCSCTLGKFGANDKIWKYRKHRMMRWGLCTTVNNVDVMLLELNYVMCWTSKLKRRKESHAKPYNIIN